MADGLKPVRRVVTGNDAQGRSCVVWDSAAPNVNPGAVNPSAGMTDVWVYQTGPVALSDPTDFGNLAYAFEPPHTGGHLRVVQSKGRPEHYDPAKDRTAVALHPPRRRPDGTWDRGGQNAFSSPVHKSETVDYGIALEGERVLLLDHGEVVMNPGDVVVQVGNWHGWTSPRMDCRMVFVMMGARFED